MVIICLISANDFPRVSTINNTPNIAFNTQMRPEKNIQLNRPNVSTSVKNTEQRKNEMIQNIATIIDRPICWIYNERKYLLLQSSLIIHSSIISIFYLLRKYFSGNHVWLIVTIFNQIISIIVNICKADGEDAHYIP